MTTELERLRALKKSGRHEDARTLALQLVQSDPRNAELQYEAACLHDFLGLGEQAIPLYRSALAGELPEDARCGAYIGLCSTYRARGRYREALEAADEGLARFGDASALKVFRAITLFNLGAGKEALSVLLALLCETTSDPQIREYEKAICLYVQDLDKQWP